MPAKVPFRERWKSFRRTLKEIKRSTKYTLLAVPLVAASAFVQVSAPSQEHLFLSGSKQYVRTINSAADSDRARFHITPKKFTLEDYVTVLNTATFTPKDTFSFYYYQPKADEIRRVELNKEKADALLNEVFSFKQRDGLTRLFSNAFQRFSGGNWAGEPSSLVQIGEKSENWKSLKFVPSRTPSQPDVGWVEIARPGQAPLTIDFGTFMAQKILSGKADAEGLFTDKERGEFREILSQLDVEKLDKITRQYEDLNGHLKLGSRSAATILLLLTAAGNLSLAARSFLREKKGSLDLDAALKRLSDKGKVPSPAEVLKEAGVPSVYSRILGASRKGPAWDVQNWFADNVAKAGLEHTTQRSLRRAQPLRPEQFVSYLAGCMLNRKQPVLYGFWGGHKESEEGVADSYDAAALEKLKSMVDSLEQKGLKKPKVKLIFSDVHSRDFNGMPEDRINAYYSGIRALAKQHGFQVVRLSSLYSSRKWRRLAPVITPEAEASARLLLEDESLRARLRGTAVKHSAFIARGEKNPDEVVDSYVTQRVFEGKMLSHVLGGIHWSYADPKTADLLPQHPTLFLHPVKYGDSRLPWFTQGEPIRQHARKA